MLRIRETHALKSPSEEIGPEFSLTHIVERNYDEMLPIKICTLARVAVVGETRDRIARVQDGIAAISIF